MAALGHWTTENRMRSTEGVLHLANQKVDAFFVDLHKTEKHFSPTTMYNDYVISEQLFHWQSQSTTSDTSPTGQRYVNHAKLGYTPLLFVRNRKNSNRASPRHSFSWVPASIALTREAVRLVSFGSSKLHCRHGSYG